MGQQQAEDQQQDGGELTRVLEARPVHGAPYLKLVGVALCPAAVGRIAVASWWVNCGAGSRTEGLTWEGGNQGLLCRGSQIEVHRCTVRCPDAMGGGDLWSRLWTHAHAAQIGAG